MRCFCGHYVNVHKYNVSLDSRDNCLNCDCPGFDLDDGYSKIKTTEENYNETSQECWDEEE